MDSVILIGFDRTDGDDHPGLPVSDECGLFVVRRLYQGGGAHRAWLQQSGFGVDLHTDFLSGSKQFWPANRDWAAWTWAFFPYAVYFSASSMWYHSLVALLLTSLLLIASYLETRTRVWMWAGFGLLFGIAVLTTPVVLAIVPSFWGGGFAIGCIVTRENGKFPRRRPDSRWSPRCAMDGAHYRVFHRPVFLKDNFWMEVCVGNLGNAVHWWNGDVHPAGIMRNWRSSENWASWVTWRGSASWRSRSSRIIREFMCGVRSAAWCTCGPVSGA